MNILFLFGAGASYGSYDCFPQKPPIGKELFDELSKMGGITSTIRGKLADLFKKDFEAGMDEFFTQYNEDVLEFIREMSLYFTQFEPGINNTYIKLIKSLDREMNEITYATTNYELLIEMAANRLGLSVKYDTAKPFSSDMVNVLKLHGSINFLPNLGNLTWHGGKFIITKAPQAHVLNAPVKIVPSIKEIKQFCLSGTPFAPAVAMFAPSKWVPVCNSFVEKQQELWKIAVFKAERIFIIGAGVHERDSHIWEPLAKSLALLTYVDPYPNGFIKWAKRNNKVMTDIIPLSFEKATSLIVK